MAKQISSGAEDLMFMIHKLMEVLPQTSCGLVYSPFCEWYSIDTLLRGTVCFRLISEFRLHFLAVANVC